MKGLRYILRVEHAYYSGVSNEGIFKRINIALNEGEGLDIEWSEFINAHKCTDIKSLEKVRDYIMRQQNSLYGHIIRAEDEDIMKRVAVNQRFEPPKQAILRTGRPRESWVLKNNEYAMSTHCDGDVYEQQNDSHIELIAFLAHGKVLGAKNIEADDWED